MGVDEYQAQNVLPLSYAGADARYLAEAFEKRCGIPSSHIFSLYSEKGTPPEQLPTRANIAALFQLISRKVGPEDTIYFYYSGHGVQMNDRSFLVTPDANPRSAETLAATALDSAELANWLKETGSQNLMVILDACREDPSKPGDASKAKFVGVLERSLKFSSPLPQQKAGLSGQVLASIFACEREHLSYESDSLEHGLFTYYFVDGLNGGAVQPDGQITLQSQMAYLGDAMQKATAKEQLPRQLPWMTYDGPGPSGWMLAMGEVPPPAGDAQRKALESEKAELLKEMASLKEAADRRAREIQKSAEEKILKATLAAKKESEALQKDLLAKLDSSNSRCEDQRQKLVEINQQLAVQREELKEARRLAESARASGEAAKAEAERQLQARSSAFDAKLAEQQRQREQLLISQAEAEASRLAALNRTSDSQPLKAVQRIEYTDAFSLFDKPRLATSQELLKELCDYQLIYEVGSDNGGQFSYDSVGKSLDFLAAKRQLDSKKPIAVEIAQIESSSNFTLESFDRPPTTPEILEKLQQGRSHRETVIVSSWKELESLNSVQHISEMATQGAGSPGDLEAMLIALEGTRAIELTSEPAVVPAKYGRNGQGELVVTSPAHQGKRYLFRRETTVYSLEIRRTKRVGGAEYSYVDRVCAYEAAQALKAKVPITVRKLGQASVEITSGSELRSYLQLQK